MNGAGGAFHEAAAPAAGVFAPVHAAADRAKKSAIIQHDTNLIVAFSSSFQDETKAVRDVPVLFRSAPDCGAFFKFRASLPPGLSALHRLF